jgi:hypothetical protein
LEDFGDGDELPFQLKRATTNTPLTTQTLKELTGRCLLACQSARLSDYHRLWEIVAVPEIEYSFLVKFDGQLVQGIELVQLDPEVNVKPSYKICAFGCTREGVHQHLSNVMY